MINMYFTTLITTFLIIVLSVSTADQVSDTSTPWAVSPEGGYVMSDEIFQQVMEKEPNFIIYIFDDSCPHCKEFTPIWTKIAQQINNSSEGNTKAFIANVKDNKQIHNGWDITGFPNIQYVKGGERKRYSDSRTEESVLTFVRKIEQLAVKMVAKEDVDDIVSGSDVTVVGSLQDPAQIAAFTKLVWEMELVPGCIVKKEEGEGEEVTVYNNFEGRPYSKTLKNLTDWEEVGAFVARARRALVTSFTRATHTIVFGGGSKMHVLLFHDQDDKIAERLDSFKKAARAFPDFVFVEMLMSDSYAQRFAGYFKVETADLPLVINNDMSIKDEPKITKHSDVSEKGILQSLNSFITQSDEELDLMKPHKDTGSEKEDPALPEDWEQRPIKHLTSVNYEGYVLDPSHHVLVMVYRDSCPHCEAMHPVMEQLAKRFENHATIKIGQMRSSHVSDIEGLEIQYVPTIIFYRQSAESLKDGIVEKDARTLEDLEKFINETVDHKNSDDKDEL